MNYQKILEVLKEKFRNVSDFAYNYPHHLSESDKEALSQTVGEFTEVSQYGGEGQGDTWYSVKYFPKHDIYIKVDGWYTSYDGTDFDGWDDACSEVRPIEKTITVYE
jgi:hypothetical protein